MSNNLKDLAIIALILGYVPQAIAADITHKATCYDVERDYGDNYDDDGNPIQKPSLGVDLWNHKVTDYKKAMELRLKEDGTIDVFYTDTNTLYGTYSSYLIENTFLNFRNNSEWQGQPVYFDWGKSFLQLRNIAISDEDDPFGDYKIPMIGEYWKGDRGEKLERLEGDKGFVSFEIKKKDSETETLKLTNFHTMYRPYIDDNGNLSRYAGDGTYCDTTEVEVIFQELKKREDFTVLIAPRKVMSKEEVKAEVEGKLAKSITCPTQNDHDGGYEVLSDAECFYVLNAIYSGLLRVNAQDIVKKNPEVRTLINKDIRIGQIYDYEVYDEQTDTWTISPEVKDAIFIQPSASHYDMPELILKALKGQE